MMKRRINSRAITVTPALNTDGSLEDSPIVDTIVVATTRGNGGHPKGSTEEKELNCKVAIIPTMNKIASLFVDKKRKRARINW